MPQESESDLTDLLRRGLDGDTDAREEVFGMIYTDLHRMASALLRREPSDNSWQPTELVNECYLYLFGHDRLGTIESRGYFFGAAINAMRRLLFDHGRYKRTAKRGGKWKRTALDNRLAACERDGITVIDLEMALQQLENLHNRQFQVVQQRIFADLQWKQIAAILEIDESTARSDYVKARAFLLTVIEGRQTRGC